MKKKVRDSRILFNGKIHIMDDERYVAESIYIEGNIIKDFGTDEYIVNKYGKLTDNKIDLKKKTALPGFNDSHMHLLMYGQNLERVDLRGVKSVNEIIKICSDFLSENKLRKGQWLLGEGWNQDLFEKNEFPTMRELDRISTEIPISLMRVCRHISACNSKALDIMGIDKDTKIEGGEIEKDNKGNLTGILKENALSFVNKSQPELSVEDIKIILKKASKKLEKFGITSIQSDDLQHGGKSWESIIEAYRELYLDNEINIRVNQQCLFFDLDEYKNFLEKIDKEKNIKNRFKIGPLKILGDGSLGARTAYMSEPYYDDKTKTGITAYTKKQLDDLVLTANQNNMPVAIHAIGDKMIDIAVNSIEKARKTTKKDLRNGIVHCQITTEDIFKKIKENKIGVYIQPIFTASDWNVVEKRIGKERSKTTYNWKRLYDMGINVSFSTDAPVESPNPYENIYAAVTRKDLNGNPEGGWLPYQRLSLDQSISAYTNESAYMSYEENIKGTLEKGMLADIVVLNDDIFSIDSEKIKEIKADLTVIDGEIIYER